MIPILTNGQAGGVAQPPVLKLALLLTIYPAGDGILSLSLAF
jgi:hypothetical protein